MKTLKFIAASLLVATAATAADLPRRGAMPAAVYAPAPIASWTGFYVGGHIGGSSFVNSNPNVSGVIGGLQIGYDQQFGSVVAGLAADISATSIRGSSGTVTGSVPYQGSLRARLGYAFSPQFLLYATGGYAYANLKVVDWAVPSSASTTVGGGLIGLGGEYKFDRNWSGFAEYRYTRLTSNGSSANTNDVRVGVNYRF